MMARRIRSAGGPINRQVTARADASRALRRHLSTRQLASNRRRGRTERHQRYAALSGLQRFCLLTGNLGVQPLGDKTQALDRGGSLKGGDRPGRRTPWTTVKRQAGWGRTARSMSSLGQQPPGRPTCRARLYAPWRVGPWRSLSRSHGGQVISLNNLEVGAATLVTASKGLLGNQRRRWSTEDGESRQRRAVEDCPRR